MDWLAEDTQDQQEKRKPWKVLIVDDDDEVHKVTKLAMKSFNFMGRELDFISAYSGNEAKGILGDYDDIAVMLVDVVMETDDAGLKLVNYIRNEQNNTKSRIVLRTGQAGLAPESEVIRDYDIDGYKAKTEITQDSLSHLFYVALRSYRDICRIDNYKDGLKALLTAVLKIDKLGNINDYSTHLLIYLCEVLDAYNAELVVNDKKPVIITIKNAGKERFNSTAQGFSETKIESLIESTLKSKSLHYAGNLTAIYHKSIDDIESVVIVEADSELDGNALELVQVFAEHVCLLLAKVETE